MRRGRHLRKVGREGQLRVKSRPWKARWMVGAAPSAARMRGIPPRARPSLPQGPPQPPRTARSPHAPPHGPRARAAPRALPSASHPRNSPPRTSPTRPATFRQPSGGLLTMSSSAAGLEVRGVVGEEGGVSERCWPQALSNTHANKMNIPAVGSLHTPHPSAHSPFLHPADPASAEPSAFSPHAPWHVEVSAGGLGELRGRGSGMRSAGG